MELFLNLNRWILEAEDDECISTMESVAAGRLREKDLAGWLRSRMVRK